jgi:imidazole glycerol-phosphate synthase subunit HisF
MLARRIIPCLDVKDGVVVKGVQFRNHVVMGDVLELAQRYSDEGADELVFYDITASSDRRVVGHDWVENVARRINIPFCVAGGIRTMVDARCVLNKGADKISINSPALERPAFITELAEEFGTQCVVVGIDSREEEGGYTVYQYTGDETKTIKSKRETIAWAKEAQSLGAGEIVLNCMNMDGVREGYDLKQLKAVREAITIPLIASGGAGEMKHFCNVFTEARVDGALAAGVFHGGFIKINDLKSYLLQEGITVRP